MEDALHRMDGGHVDQEFLKNFGGRELAPGHGEFYLFDSRRFSRCRIG
jgi:hypothetical protein